MSSSPFIKRAKARTNLRQRDETTPVSPLARAADDAGEDDEEMSISPMQMAKNRKKDKEKKKSGSIGKSRLSFGVEDEEVGTLDSRGLDIELTCKNRRLRHPRNNLS